MNTEKDIAQIEKKGITQEQIERQLHSFATGFPFLRLKAAASPENGILVLNEAERRTYVKRWEQYKSHGHKITKFVPASGAASRMFKNLFAFLDAPYSEPATPFEKEFFAGIKKFAFYPALDDACHVNTGQGIEALMEAGDYKAIVRNLLSAEGLNYGQLPKGLLQFHTYPDEARTPLEEHLVEAALYAASGCNIDVHFTVSPEHRPLFQALVDRLVPVYNKRHGGVFHVSFSEQKPSTDTIAVNTDNTPFRNDDGSLLFRPGGHGALIQNLADLESDVVFIKNIDNVVPDRLKEDTIEWKQVLAGILIDYQNIAFSFIKKLDSGRYSHNDLMEIVRFVRHRLFVDIPGLKDLEDTNLAIALRSKLNRPMRVCGVVKNVGEPGGGPFLAYNPDGSVSPQILESSQIDTNNAEYMKMFAEGTHFNPVDLVCALRDYQGNKFDLPKYIDPATGFISQKSKNGRDLKALELPGLWNGAMSDWSTVFVEVPLSTFNPVKTVNDLLREQHQ